MYSVTFFCRLFLVVLPALAASSSSQSASSASSTSSSVSSTSAPSSSSSVLSSSTRSTTPSTRASSSSSTVLSSSTSSRTRPTSVPSSRTQTRSSRTQTPSSQTQTRSSRTQTRSSSTPASSVSSVNVGSILAAPNPSAVAVNGDPSIAASFAKLAAEFGEFEAIIAKGLQSIDNLTSAVEAANIRALIATNEQLAYKLAQAQTALAASKALALRNAQQAQADLVVGKKACTLIQDQLDKWAQIGKDASVSYVQASGVATGLSYYIKYPITSFTQESTLLGCPAKGGKVCECVQAVVLVLTRSQQSVTGIVSSGSGTDQALRQRATVVASVVQNVEQAIYALQDALMC